MASFIYNSALNDIARSQIDCDTDTFKVMLLTNVYGGGETEKDTHTKRSNLTNEVSGTGYTAGGATVTVTVNAVDTVNNRQDITLGGFTWTTSTITARYAAYYKSRGGAATADELVALVDFGSDIISNAGNFALTASTLRMAN